MQNVSKEVTGSIKAETHTKNHPKTGLSKINVIQQFKQFVAISRKSFFKAWCTPSPRNHVVWWEKTDWAVLAERRSLWMKCMLASVLETVLYSDLHFLLGTSRATDPDARQSVWATSSWWNYRVLISGDRMLFSVAALLLGFRFLQLWTQK